MNRRSWHSLILLVGITTCIPIHAKEPRSDNDVRKLQGTWIADLEPGLRARLVLNGSDLRLVHLRKHSETLIWDGQFAVNETVLPKQMDWTPLRNKSPSVPANLAIYHLSGDLLLVIGSTEGSRPTAFYSGGGPHRPKTIIFHREKKTDPRESKRQKPQKKLKSSS